jgi:hypothetical protein
MTTITIQRFAEDPRTTLDGIPSAFFAWAKTVHGWDKPALLRIGQAAACSGNALDELVEHHRRLSEGGKVCCSCSFESAPHSIYGGLLSYCDDEFPLYAEKDLAKYMKDDALCAAGLLTTPRYYVGI